LPIGQVFTRETQSARFERAFETPFVFQGNPAVVQMLSEAALQSNGLTPVQQSQLDAENSRSTELNRPIAEVLCAVSGEKLGPSAKDWWKWWERYNEAYSESKPTQRTVEPKYRSPLPLPLPPTWKGECFAAGTTIWTLDGPKAVERVSVGDLVLSQNVDTGELAYKPVLRAAERPPIAARQIAPSASMPNSQC